MHLRSAACCRWSRQVGTKKPLQQSLLERLFLAVATQVVEDLLLISEFEIANIRYLEFELC
jgi:hypothetical protein